MVPDLEEVFFCARLHMGEICVKYKYNFCKIRVGGKHNGTVKSLLYEL